MCRNTRIYLKWKEKKHRKAVMYLFGSEAEGSVSDFVYSNTNYPDTWTGLYDSYLNKCGGR